MIRGIVPRLATVEDSLPDGLAELAAAADAEGFFHIQRLVDEWASGENRFARPGERLLVAFADTRPVGVGGMNLEFSRGDWLRMRRFYVAPDHRGRGIGRMLASDLLAHSRAFADTVTVHAADSNAALFWEAMGFRAFAQGSYTHILEFA